MTFLKQLGLDIVKGLAIIAGFAPLISAAVPGSSPVVAVATSDINKLLSIITGVEAVGAAITPNMTGAQKLVAATPQIAQVFLQLESLAGLKQENPTLFTNGAAQVASGLANILNSYKAEPAAGTPTLTTSTVA